MKILLFGGTTEGRVLAQKLLALGHAVTVSVATALGAEMLGDFPKDHILTGRLEQPAIARRLPDYALCIDATHPYAVDATRNIRTACRTAGPGQRRPGEGRLPRCCSPCWPPDAPSPIAPNRRRRPRRGRSWSRAPR